MDNKETTNILRRLMDGNLIVIASNEQENADVARILEECDIYSSDFARDDCWAGEWEYTLFAKSCDDDNRIYKTDVEDESLSEMDMYLAANNMISGVDSIPADEFVKKFEELKDSLKVNTIVTVNPMGSEYYPGLFKISNVNITARGCPQYKLMPLNWEFKPDFDLWFYIELLELWKS